MPITRRDAKKAKILYIEDNRENRMLVRAILEAEGYTIVDAEDGLAGIEAAIREEPALILLDVNLPAIDGYEVVAVIKSFPAFATTPVIAVTAYAMEGDRQRTLVAGCDGYIQKPIDVDAFPHQVEEFLHGKREHVEEREAGVYLRELNQRLVYRLVNQVEELKRLNQHFVRRATQLADLHRAVQDITSEVGVTPMLEQLLGALARALGTRSLAVELPEYDVKVAVSGEAAERPRSVLAGAGLAPADEWTEVDWSLPLAVRGRTLGVMTARHVLPPGAKADEEQLLNIVANQVAIAVENARLYDGVVQRAAEQQSLVEAGHLLASSLRLADVLQRFTELVRTRIGVDVGVTRQRREFTKEEVALVQALATSAAVAIRNARLYEETQTRLRHNETLVSVSQAIGATLELSEVLRRATREMVRALSGDMGVAWLLAPDRTHFVPLVGYHIPRAVLHTPVASELKLNDPVVQALTAARGPIVQSTKLAAIGELAANIAHEINNPLTTVLGFASFIAERLPAEDPMREELGLIQEEASRARDIVRDLLQFSRQRDFMPEPADVNMVLEQVVAMIRRQGAFGAVAVTEAYGEELPMVEMDVPRIKQVFLNIINNAVYAMKDGGSLTIRTTAASEAVRIAF